MKKKLFLMMTAVLFFANADAAVTTEAVNGETQRMETEKNGTVDTAAIQRKVDHFMSVFKFNAEVSLSYRQHNVTPVFSYLTFSYEPVNRLKFGVSYIHFLGLRSVDGDRDYLTSHGIGGSVSYRLSPGKKDNRRHGFELRGRYGHSLGSADMKYNLYDIGITCNNDYGIGYRYVDSKTAGISNSSQVYLSLIF